MIQLGFRFLDMFFMTRVHWSPDNWRMTLLSLISDQFTLSILFLLVMRRTRSGLREHVRLPLLFICVLTKPSLFVLCRERRNFQFWGHAFVQTLCLRDEHFVAGEVRVGSSLLQWAHAEGILQGLISTTAKQWFTGQTVHVRSRHSSKWAVFLVPLRPCFNTFQTRKAPRHFLKSTRTSWLPPW